MVPAWVHGDYTARKALEALTRTVPREVASQLVAILGFNGSTEPETWLFLALDPSSPGQLLEFQVQGGTVRGPRPLPPEEAPKGLQRPLPWGSLPVDSHDVARIIDDAVILEGVNFSRIDYQLCWRDSGPEPLWMATLVGSRGETLGHMFISSFSGAVTHRAFYHSFPRPATASVEPVETPAVNRQPSRGSNLQLFRKKPPSPVSGEAEEKPARKLPLFRRR